MVAEDVETTTSDDDTRLLVGNLADSLCLCFKQLVARLVMLGAIILGTSHVRTIEVGKVVAPQRIAGFIKISNGSNWACVCFFVSEKIINKAENINVKKIILQTDNRNGKNIVLNSTVSFGQYSHMIGENAEISSRGKKLSKFS